MKKLNIMTALIIFLFTQNCFSQNNGEQVDDEYKESKFQGAEEPETGEIQIFKLTSCSIGKQDINLNPKVDFLKVDYSTGKINLKYKDKIKSYSFQMTDDTTNWSQLAQYTRIGGYIWNETEKHKFYVEAMGGEAIGFYILRETKQGITSMWFFGDL